MDEANNQIDPIENNGDNMNGDFDFDEDEDSYDEDYWYHSLDNSNFQKLKRNDPSITDIHIELNCNISGECSFNSIDWKEDGECISKNAQLKRLLINFCGKCLERPYYKKYILGEQGGNLPTRQQLQDFFSCLYQNDSIKDIRISSIFIDDEFGGDFIKGLSGHPSIETFDIRHGRLGSIVCCALGKVLKHPQTKLKDLLLSRCKLDDEGLSALCNGLLGNSTLKKLNLRENTAITPVGWRALSTVLKHPNCKLVELDLYGTMITDHGSNILGSALIGSSLKVLDLSNNRTISSTGWKALFNQLSRTSIEILNLENNEIGNAALETLTGIHTLKSLNLKAMRSSSPAGWSSFFNLLQRRGIQLKKLDISHNCIGDVGMAALGSLLGNMCTLRTLIMFSMISIDSSGFNISSQGWIAFLNSLQDTQDLERLDLSNNNIGNKVIQFLVQIVSIIPSLKQLSLGINRSVTTAGWQALTGYLRSPNFALRELHLNGNSINDDTVIEFKRALEHNKTLELLILDGTLDEETDENNSLITKRGRGAISSLVYNKTSIMDTYNSNHTLHKLGYDQDEMDVPEHLSSSLELNKNKDKVEVARQKILQTHFSTEGDGSSKIQELLDMDLEVMPTVVEWIGRPTHNDWTGKSVSGLSLMYNLTRRLPDLFDASPQKKVVKRKRDS